MRFYTKKYLLRKRYMKMKSNEYCLWQANVVSCDLAASMCFTAFLSFVVDNFLFAIFLRIFL